MIFVLGALYGLAAAIFFRAATDAGRLRVARNRLIARVLELHLFIDEPALVLRSYRDLTIENLRLLRLIALPCAILAAVFAAAYLPMDRRFGHAPLRPGETATVIAPNQVGAVRGLTVETPPVRIRRSGLVAWRVRANGSPIGSIPGARVIYPRSASWLGWFTLGWFTLASAAAAGLYGRLRTVASTMSANSRT